jgi:hypothetical protein
MFTNLHTARTIIEETYEISRPAFLTATCKKYSGPARTVGKLPSIAQIVFVMVSSSALGMRVDRCQKGRRKDVKVV